MNFWIPVLAASLGTYLEKLTGHFVPQSLLANPHFKRLAEALPVGLLAGLIAYQTFGSGQSLGVDGRLAGAVIAGVILWRGGSFILVVLSAAILTAVGRALGWLV